MYIAILGRQPALGLAELERVFRNATRFSQQTALFESPKDSTPDVEKLGGSLKLGQVVLEIPGGKKNDWRSISMAIVNHYAKKWATHENKITLGVSIYDISGAGPRDVQKTGLVLKTRLKSTPGSLRLIPNTEIALSTATSHHNKLGLADNKIELLVAQAPNGRVVVAESTGSQNITALAARDQGRPKRDAFVGMLPPKLAQIMINLAAGSDATGARLLDPFCGTGVILQEAALLGYAVYGSDLSEKMIRYSRDNLNWLQESHRLDIDWYLHEGDATSAKWQQPVDLVVAETYLGQPFSAPPSSAKLTEVRGNCDHIIKGFLKNLSEQIQSGTPVCIAVPAWRGVDGTFTHLPLVTGLGNLGYKRVEFSGVSQDDLLYYREDQVVARELLVLVKS
jgi:tRNA G10  N-methylase Trm11